MGGFKTLVEKLLDSFSKGGGNTLIIRETDVGKHAILSRFFIMKKPNFNFPVKAHLMQPNLHLL